MIDSNDIGKSRDDNGSGLGRAPPIPFPSQSIRGGAGRGSWSHSRFQITIKISSPTRMSFPTLSWKSNIT